MPAADIEPDHAQPRKVVEGSTAPWSTRCVGLGENRTAVPGGTENPGEVKRFDTRRVWVVSVSPVLLLEQYRLSVEIDTGAGKGRSSDTLLAQ